jgi:hypothetical protein
MSGRRDDKLLNLLAVCRVATISVVVMDALY